MFIPNVEQNNVLKILAYDIKLYQRNRRSIK